MGGQDAEGYDIWIHDLTRSIKTRLTFDPGWDGFPRWSPSGGEVTFGSDRNANGASEIFKRSADGTGEAELLVGSPDEIAPASGRPTENIWCSLGEVCKPPRPPLLGAQCVG